MLNTKIIGQKIAEARKKTNISQARLAERLFISPQAVGKWERGESLPDIITLNLLAEILGVDLNYFSENFRSVDTGNPPAEVPEKRSDKLPSLKHTDSDDPKPDSFRGKKLSWDMSRGNWADADFSGLKNLHEKFSSSNMQRCLFIGSDLSGLLLNSNNIESCDFSGSNLSNSHIERSHLSNNKFKACLLKETELSGSHISGCDYSGANLAGSEFSESYIYGCDFTGADFTGVKVKSGSFSGVVAKSGNPEKSIINEAIWNRTSFMDSQIADIVFTGTLADCYFENCAFARVTFRNARLINTFFKNKSLRRVQFIDCQADRMTYEFLKAGKADLSGITLLSPEENE